MSTSKIVQNTLLFAVLTAPFGCSASSLRESNVMSNKESCQATRFATSTQIIQTLLDDLNQNYDQVGGEISQIKLTATNVYIVAVSQEERIDQITYEVMVKPNCAVEIIKKSVAAVSAWDSE